MADIRLINILSPLGVQQPQFPSGGAPSNQPILLVNFPAGSILSGFIINRDAAGNPLLRTEHGDVLFRSSIFLKIGSEIVIRVENRAGSTLAHILSIDGQPPEVVAGQQSHFYEEPDVIMSRALTPSSLPASGSDNTSPVKPTVMINGHLLPQEEPGAWPTNHPSSQPFSFKVLSLATPSDSATPTNTVASANPSLYAVYAKTANTSPPLSSSQASHLSAQNPGSIPTPVIHPSASIAARASSDIIAATIVSVEPTGAPLLQTPFGIVRLQPDVTFTLGTKLTLQILTNIPETRSFVPTPNAPAATPAPIEKLAYEWNSIQKIASLLLPYEKQNVIPWLPVFNTGNSEHDMQPQNISSGLMFFVSALRGGDFSGWLGKRNIEWLRNSGHEALLQKAEAEFSLMSRTLTDATQQPNQWQAVFYPLAVDGKLEQIRFFVKRDRRRQKREFGKDEQDTRFVVEMNLSQLGALQFDGFVRRNPQQIEFDLYIRSRSQFSERMQKDIALIYNNIGQITGYQGNLLFQMVKDFPVNPMEDIQKKHLSDMRV